MDDPRPRVQSLAAQGWTLYNEAKTTVPSARGRDLGAKVGTALLAEVFGVPRLQSPTARQVGRLVLDHQAEARRLDIAQRYERWYGEASALLGTISVARKNLTTRGNSRELLARLAATRKAAKGETRAAKGARFLEGVADQELVYNGEIPALLKRRQVDKLNERRMREELRLLDIPEVAPGFEHFKFPNRAALRQRLDGFPDEARMIEGAIDTFLGDGPDRHRQALASCRVALESAGKRVTDTDRWRSAVGEVADDSTRRIFRETFDFLSKYGAHAGSRRRGRRPSLGYNRPYRACCGSSTTGSSFASREPAT